MRYSAQERRLRAMPLGVAQALGRLVDAAPSLELIVFTDEKPPSHTMGGDSDEDGHKTLSDFLLEDGERWPDNQEPNAAGRELVAARDRRGGRLMIAVGNADGCGTGNINPGLTCRDDAGWRLFSTHGGRGSKILHIAPTEPRTYRQV